HYAAGNSTKPRRFASFDRKRWTFVALPSQLVDAMVAGESALTAGRAAEAREALSQALALVPEGANEERAELENTYGLASYQSGDTAEARLAWQRSLLIDPSNRGALLNLAAMRAGRGDFLDARNLTERVLRENPEDPLALYYFARLSRALGDEAGAERAWNSLANSQPQFADSVSRRDGAP